jgi:glycosyltransferase involved in cell wall biosynthesis
VNYAATRFHQIAGYYGLIDRFIVPSGFTLEKMVDAGWDRGRLSHVPTLVAPSRSSDGISDRPPVVVYVGRLDKLKGVHLLLEAVRLLTSTRGRPTFELRIVGSGDADYVETLTNFVSEHGLSNVAFLGERGEDEVRAELRGARCSVAPSLWYENMPNSVLESMAEGTPVVAPDHGSFPEIVRGGETGVLVRPGDPVALADGIEALVQDPGAASRLGARAAEFVAAHHSADRHYERLLNVFSDARQAALKN